MAKPSLTVEKEPVAKYLVANIAGDRVIVCSIVDENEIVEAINQMLNLAGERAFDMTKFYYKGSSGNNARLRNGTMLQYLYVGQS